MLADGDVGSFDAVLLINQAAYFPLSYSIKQPLKNMHAIQNPFFIEIVQGCSLSNQFNTYFASEQAKILNQISFSKTCSVQSNIHGILP